jgi:DNA repair exonuclease SbcCD ATPase subunit
MEPLTIRIQEETKKTLEDEAGEYNVSVSEYIRRLIDQGREYDRIREKLASREDRITQLESQLSRRSEIEDKIEDLPDKIRGAETYQAKRQRILDQASVAERLKWRVTGVPVEQLTED